MSKQETDKMNVKQESLIKDLPVDDAQQDEVKGGNRLPAAPVVDLMIDPVTR